MSESQGEWKVVGRSGVVGVHAALLHTRQVLFFARSEYPSHKYNKLDNGLPGDATHSPEVSDVTLSAIVEITGPDAYKPVAVQVEHNPFCSGFTFLADGRLLVAGGDKKDDRQNEVPEKTKDGRNSLRVFVPHLSRTINSGEWKTIGRISDSRWYPTCTLLQDGRVLVVSGYLDDMEVYNNQNPTCELIPPMPDGPQYLFPLVEAWPYDGYPFVFVLPSGSVFLFAKDRAYLLELERDRFGKEKWAVKNGPKLPQREESDLGPTKEMDEPAKQYPNSATAVLLPLLPENEYAPEVLVIGGGGVNVHRHLYGVPSTPLKTYEVEARKSCFRLSASSPSLNKEWRRQRNMENRRVMPDAVLLPDGKVLVVNGVSKGFAGGNPATGPAIPKDWKSGEEYAVRKAELYDPVKDEWQTLAEAKCTRLYHSTALLLPDARVLVAGSDHQVNERELRSTPDANEKRNHLALGYEYELEVFSPPYLFKDTPRPVIENEQNQKPIVYGQQFQIEVRDLPTMEVDSLRVALLHPGSVTHGNNMSQRHVGIKILEKSETHLTLEAPPNGCVAPPGYYMLFLLHRGVPSEAQFVKLLPHPTDKASYANLTTSGMALWLRADTGVVADATGAVSSWSDLSGNGHDVFLKTKIGNAPERPPKWIQTGLNGHPVLRFSLFAHWDSAVLICGACLASRNGSFLPGSSPYAMFIVTHPWPPAHKHGDQKSGDRGWADLIGWGDFNVPDTSAFVGLRFGPGPNRSTEVGDEIPKHPGTATVLNYWNHERQFGTHNQFGIPDQEREPRVALSSAFLLEAFFDGVDTGIRMNGNEIKRDTAPAEGRRTEAGPLTIGQNGDQGTFFRGDIAEVLVYDRVITDDERTQIQEYLRTRYDLW